MEIEIREIIYLSKQSNEKKKTKITNLNPDCVFVYDNTFDIKLNKDKQLKIYEYPFSIKSDIEETGYKSKEIIFNHLDNEIQNIYGSFYISNNSLYGLKEVDHLSELQTKIKASKSYKVMFQPFSKCRIIKSEDLQKDKLLQIFIKKLVIDSLKKDTYFDYNQTSLFFRDIQKIKDDEDNKEMLKFYPSLKNISFLDVELRRKYLSKETVLDFLIANDYINIKAQGQDDLRNKLIGKSFETLYSKKKYKIDDINFDKNPLNQTIYDQNEKKSVTLKTYFYKKHGLSIKNSQQPLLVLRRKGSLGEVINLHLIPELCYMNRDIYNYYDKMNIFFRTFY